MFISKMSTQRLVNIHTFQEIVLKQFVWISNEEQAHDEQLWQTGNQYHAQNDTKIVTLFIRQIKTLDSFLIHLD